MQVRTSAKFPPRFDPQCPAENPAEGEAPIIPITVSWDARRDRHVDIEPIIASEAERIDPHLGTGAAGFRRRGAGAVQAP